ncbi:DUF5361 domain-containing protein [Microvirga sp. 3-52]|nr:DUF5361 domain-containing protein [Microvirga sp. 3-52]
MIKTDEDALVCDLAETYNIYDYRQHSPMRVAVFSCGLRDDSRIKMNLSGQVVPMDTLLLAGMSDRLSTLLWFKTEDGQKGKNRPASIIDMLTNRKSAETERDTVIFNSGEDFIRARNELTGGE